MMTRRNDMYRKRFGLTGHPMPKNAAGKTYYDKSTNHARLSVGARTPP